MSLSHTSVNIYIYRFPYHPPIMHTDIKVCRLACIIRNPLLVSCLLKMNTSQWQFCHHPLLHCQTPGKGLWPGLHPLLWCVQWYWVHESCSLFQSCGTAWLQSRCICDTVGKDIIQVITTLFILRQKEKELYDYVLSQPTSVQSLRRRTVVSVGLMLIVFSSIKLFKELPPV